VAVADKPLVWLHGEIRTPPFATEARIEAGVLLRRLQRGESLGIQRSRPKPAIARRCHELRVRVAAAIWRIVYRTDGNAIVIGEVFAKRTRTAPKDVIATCQKRFREYDDACK
jgi:phage-related protein